MRVALVAIIADHPAMCKLCGFADHSHNEAPCTKCKVSKAELFTDKSLRNGKFICSYSYDSNCFYQNFLLATGKNIDDYVTNTETSPRLKKRRSFSPNTAPIGRGLLGFTILISCDTLLLTQCITYFSVSCPVHQH